VKCGRLTPEERTQLAAGLRGELRLRRSLDPLALGAEPVMRVKLHAGGLFS
jgi:hypothetical protein